MTSGLSRVDSRWTKPAIAGVPNVIIHPHGSQTIGPWPAQVEPPLKGAFYELACSQGVKEQGGPFAFYRNPYSIVSRKKIEIVICQYLTRILLFLSF